MKTIVKASTNPLSWYFLPDSALINSGKPFFIPEFADEFEALLAPVVRITRIGKSIGARFAHRYYSEIAPAVHFRAPLLMRRLLAASLPPDPSYGFDRSLIVGSFLPASELLDGDPLLMTLTNKDGDNMAESHIPTETLTAETASFLEAVSRANTIKMGDYLIPTLSTPVRITIGDTISVSKASSGLLSVQIR